jgi:hypothetical protein
MKKQKSSYSFIRPHLIRIRIVTIIFAFLFSANIINSQKVITLKECYESAISVNALAQEKKAFSDISTLKEENISKAWWPSLDLNGSMLYNSSVIDLSSALGSLPVPYRKCYKTVAA